MTHSKLTLATLAVLTLAALGACATQPMDDKTAAVEARRVCSFCHGVSGRSINPAFPNLAGQSGEYLTTQLKTFRDRSRGDSRAHIYMWGVAAHLSDGAIEELAGYYAALPPAVAKEAESDASRRGGTIFAQGIEAQSVPACSACHGEKAEGMGPIPRLAGQNRSYLERQLSAFATRDRNNDIMHENTKNLTLDQVADIAAYLSSR